MMAEFPKTDLDALRFAIISETDAIELYNQLAVIVKDNWVRAVFLDIAKEEKTHFGEFQALLAKLDPEFAGEIENGSIEVMDKPEH